ncbi:hypothetical protein [Enterococcus faecalis]|uniref:hypothetical protein n=1 Tax=Enterococcus faecalis TaxID=1351 RepID=UPI0025AFB72E|nr:hypothetical protein [Enterococcus faecalis]MDN3169369.1 hypothetical protein [Enterococcus faecalis]
MERKKYYSVKTALNIIDPDFSIRTFYGWIRRIEEKTSYRFLRKEGLIGDNIVKRTLLTDDDLALLEQLYHYRVEEEENLTLAIYRVFWPAKYEEIIALNDFIL